jgi:acetylornithine deacetylase/succinyl-diaminopimelate desuccinylase-like protein
MLLDINWRPALAVIGADGLPPVQTAGNVLRTNTDLKLSFRIPPGVEAETVQNRVKEILEADPPYGAQVTYEAEPPSNGFRAPAMDERVAAALDEAAMQLTDSPPMTTWIGGTIPFMAMIQQKYPGASFLCTGSSGPGNNAHGPDEKLHIPHSKRVNVVLAAAVAALCE